MLYSPPGLGPAGAELSESVASMMIDLVNSRTTNLGSWSSIPGSELDIRLRELHGEALTLLVRRQKKWVYANIFCVDRDDFFMAKLWVEKFYWKYHIGGQTAVRRGKWINMIPINGAVLSTEDLQLMTEVTQFVYWSIERVFGAPEHELAE